MPYRVHLVDDHEMFRHTLVEFLEMDPRFTVEVAAQDAGELLRALSDAREPPDLLILDLSLPDLDGIDLLAEILRRHPALPIIVLSGQDAQTYRRRALEAGALEFVSKAGEPDDILRTIRRALQLSSIGGRDVEGS